MKLFNRKSILHKLIVLTLVASFSTSTISVFAATTTSTTGQDVTAYTSRSGKVTHSGVTPYLGSCAVHLRKSTDYMIPGNGPGIVNFGSTAVLSVAVPMYPGTTSRSIFTVEDTGDPDYNHSRFFIDVWQGVDSLTGPINTWCLQKFGVIKYMKLI